MTAVWQLDLAPSEKLVLLALADNANDEGHCWPSITTIADKCSMHRRTVIRTIQELEIKRCLTRSGDSGKSNAYTVHPWQYATSDKSPPVAIRHQTSGNTPLPPVAIRHPTRGITPPRNIIEPSFESSENRHTEGALSDDFEDYLTETYPKTAYRADFTTAFKWAHALVSLGHATEDDLRRRVAGYRDFCNSGGASDSSKVATPQKWFALHQQGEAYWAKEWAAIPSKAQKQQDSNIDVARRFLEAS